MLIVRPRRKFQIAVEALFMIDFPSLKHKFSFFLDRKQMRVTLDVASNSIIHSKHFNVPNINETSIIRSLAFHFHENTVTLHVDCSESAKVDIDVGLSKLYFQMDEPIVKLFRERKYPLHFDLSIQSAFGRSNCQKGAHKHSGKRIRNRQLDKGNEFFFAFLVCYVSLSISEKCCILISSQREIRNATFVTGINQQMIDIMMQLKRNHAIHYDEVIYQFCMAIVMISCQRQFKISWLL